MLYYAQTRWLSHGNVLERIYQLKAETEMFLVEKRYDLHSWEIQTVWTALFSYLMDIFGHLNALNKSLQGKGEHVISMSEKIQGFRCKLDLWETRLKTDKSAAFPKSREYLKDTDSEFE